MSGAFIVGEDASGDATLWLVVGDADPKPVIAIHDLRPDMRHLWDVIVQGVGARPAA